MLRVKTTSAVTGNEKQTVIKTADSVKSPSLSVFLQKTIEARNVTASSKCNLTPREMGMAVSITRKNRAIETVTV